jgi:acyl-CoA reductase-like NAD-dependent aldehyde dehydrogenase
MFDFRAISKVRIDAQMFINGTWVAKDGAKEMIAVENPATEETLGTIV